MSADTDLDSLLEHPAIWRGGSGAGSGLNTLPTGFDVLDHYLPGNGWPTDSLTEILLDRYGIGELSLLMPALAGLSRQAVSKRRWIVWVGPPFVPYAPALSKYGVDLSCILLVHPSNARHDVLWATEQIIRSGSGIAVFAWVGQTTVTALRRLQLGAEARQCWTVLFRPAASSGQPSPAQLRIGLSPAADASPAHFRVRLDMLKCRGRRPRTLWVGAEDIGAQHFRDGVSECR